MRNLKLILQYDGSAFHGFQIQPSYGIIMKIIVKNLPKMK